MSNARWSGLTSRSSSARNSRGNGRWSLRRLFGFSSSGMSSGHLSRLQVRLTSGLRSWVPVSGVRRRLVPVSGASSWMPVSGHVSRLASMGRLRSWMPVSGVGSWLVPVSGVRRRLMPVSGVRSRLVPVSGVRRRLVPVSGVSSRLMPVSGVSGRAFIAALKAQITRMWEVHLLDRILG